MSSSNSASPWSCVDGRRQRYSRCYRGYSLFYSGKNAQPSQSLRAAEHLGGALRAQGFTPSLHHAEAIRGENRPLIDAEKGIYRFDDLVVLKMATMPAVLIEAGVIVHPLAEQLLETPLYRGKMVDAITAAVGKACTDSAASDGTVGR